ncbi:MAG: DUF2607 family protein [bacterium]
MKAKKYNMIRYGIVIGVFLGLFFSSIHAVSIDDDHHSEDCSICLAYHTSISSTFTLPLINIIYIETKSITEEKITYPELIYSYSSRAPPV